MNMEADPLLSGRRAPTARGLCCIAMAGVSWSALLLHPDKAHAQGFGYDRGQNQSVLDRASAMYGPDGLPLGGFRLYPNLGLQETYDDNIYAAQVNTRDDAIGVIQPQFRLASDWNRNQLSVYGQDAFTRYVNHPTENSNAWTLGGSGEFDIRSDWAIQARVEHQRAVEPRTDPSTPIAAAKPTLYDLQLESLQVTETLDRFQMSVQAEDDTFTYGRVPLNGGGVLDDHFRDNSHYTYTGSLQYAISPEVAVYSRVSYNAFDFKHFFPNLALSYAPSPGGGLSTSPTYVALPSNLNQNSDGYTADIGSDFDISHLMRGSLAIGYLAQNAHDSRLPNYSGPHGQAQLDYFVTPLITAHLTFSRSVAASGLTGSPAFLSTDVKGAVEYALRNNIILSAGAGGGWDNYKGISRNDLRQSYNLAATYYMGRHLSLSLRYNRSSLDSSGSGAGQSFAVDQVGLSIVYAR